MPVQTYKTVTENKQITLNQLQTEYVPKTINKRVIAYSKLKIKYTLKTLRPLSTLLLQSSITLEILG